MYWKKLFISFSAILLTMASLFSQEPTQQDCLGAIYVCHDSYYEPYAPTGTGIYPEEIPDDGECPENCQMGETNSRWYRIDIQTSGILSMTIDPDDYMADYDWVIYDLSNYGCSDILEHHSEMQLSCNSVGGGGNYGITGISTSNGGTAHCNGPGNGNIWNEDLAVDSGQALVLCIMNWDPDATDGYYLDFSESTAYFFDTLRPHIDTVYADNLTVGDFSLEFSFNEDVMCDGIQEDDFEIIGPNGEVHIPYDLFSTGCTSGYESEKNFKLFFSPPIQEYGLYKLKHKTFSGFEDFCGNLANPEEFPFLIGNTPEDPPLPLQLKIITE